MKKAAQLLFPENALARLLARDHGRPRAQAVAAATVRLTAQQDMAMAALESLIAGLETNTGNAGQMGRDADRIVTLAQAFGLAPLADAARRLCDLVALLQRDGRNQPEAVAVHIQALRLFSPGSPIIGDAEAAMVLGRIAALAAHLSMR